QVQVDVLEVMRPCTADADVVHRHGRSGASAAEWGPAGGGCRTEPVSVASRGFGGKWPPGPASDRASLPGLQAGDPLVDPNSLKALQFRFCLPAAGLVRCATGKRPQ